jgi:hypothetical protein
MENTLQAPQIRFEQIVSEEMNEIFNSTANVGISVMADRYCPSSDFISALEKEVEKELEREKQARFLYNSDLKQRELYRKEAEQFYFFEN